jgi:2-hydroxychromene-2-carboxylate isomerase
MMVHSVTREPLMGQTAPQFMFGFGSPNAFLSHEAIPAIEKRIGVKFEYVPILLGGIFKATNNKSPAETLADIKNEREFHVIETKRFGANVNFPILETTDRVFRKVWEMACWAGFLAGASRHG